MKKLGFSGVFCLVSVIFLSGSLTGCDEINKLLQTEQKSETTEQVTDAPDQVTEGAAEANEVADLSAHPGKLQHDANCISCHDSAVYTREDRRITDFTMLQAQVKRCDANLGSRLSDEELQQVTAYLNQAYYNYGQ